MKTVATIIALMLLGACSAPQHTRFDAHHPASPDAAAGVPARTYQARPAPQLAGAAPDHTAQEHPAAVHQHAAPAPASTPVPVATLYMCPMHPKVTSNNPEDRCPQCGMKVNQKVTSEAPK